MRERYRQQVERQRKKGGNVAESGGVEHGKVWRR